MFYLLYEANETIEERIDCSWFTEAAVTVTPQIGCSWFTGYWV